MLISPTLSYKNRGKGYFKTYKRGTTKVEPGKAEDINH